MTLRLKISSFFMFFSLQNTETSPASSLHSLPISPCSEKSLPVKVNFCFVMYNHNKFVCLSFSGKNKMME